MANTVVRSLNEKLRPINSLVSQRTYYEIEGSGKSESNRYMVCVLLLCLTLVVQEPLDRQLRLRSSYMQCRHRAKKKLGVGDRGVTNFTPLKNCAQFGGG